MKTIHYKEPTEVTKMGIQVFMFLIPYNTRLTGNEFAELIGKHFDKDNLKTALTIARIKEQVKSVFRSYTKFQYELI